MIETNSRRLARVARLCRFLPPAVSGRVCVKLYPLRLAQEENASFRRRSSLGDVEFTFHRCETYATAFALRGFYQWQNVVIANAVCQPGDTIIDVGANMGTETALFALIVGPAGRVLAFEPLGEVFEVLQRVIRENGLENVSAFQKAVSDRPGVFSFSLPSDAQNTGTGSLLAAGNGSNAVDVEVVVLDEVAAAEAAGRVSLIVMDAEGVEMDVLRGSSRLMRDNRPAIITEINPPLLAQQGLSVAAAREFFASRGYVARRITGWGLVPADDSQQRVRNWFCSPRDAAGQELARRVSRRLRWAAVAPLIRGLSPAVVARRAAHGDSAR